VSKRQVCQGSLAGFVGPVEIKSNEGNNSNQAADVLFIGTALARRQPPCIICKKIAVAFSI
jgi:hypothetical protein